jgi:NADPH-dependent glutamate synthase beta subunit-like oxidoreductase
MLGDVNLGGEVKVGKKVAVIGGGNVAIDAGMTALRLGANEVQLICLESPGEMLAHKEGINDAVEEGILIRHGWGVKRIKGKKRVSGVDLVKCTSVFYHEDKFHPAFNEKISATLEADTVIIAVGQTVDLSHLDGELIRKTASGTIAVNPYTLETALSSVFAGGDVVTGPKSAVDAAAAGKIAAESIDRWIQGKGLIREDPYTPFVKIERPSAFVDPSETIFKENSLRAVVLKLSPLERKTHFGEIVLGLNEEQAVQEAKRCLKYDLELEEESAKRLAQSSGAPFVLSP